MSDLEHPLSPEKQPVLQDFSLEKSQISSKMDLNSMDQAQLLALYVQIEAKLPSLRLADINLEKETMLQLVRAKQLQEDANKKDSGVPMNQRAQVQNSIANILSTLAKMQMELHDSESLKRLRAAVIKVVKAQPKEFQAQFFDMLETEFAAVEKELAA